MSESHRKRPGTGAATAAAASDLKPWSRTVSDTAACAAEGTVVAAAGQPAPAVGSATVAGSTNSKTEPGRTADAAPDASSSIAVEALTSPNFACAADPSAVAESFLRWDASSWEQRRIKP